MIVKIRDFIFGLVDLLLSFIRIIILSKFIVRFPRLADEKKECIILGNGPSLRQSLAESSGFLSAHPVIAVNNFVFSEQFELLKPAYYILNAPEYFMAQPPTQAHIEQRNKVFSNLISKTGWKIFVFVPQLARKTDFWKTELSKNRNIEIVYYNSTPVEGPQWIVNILYKMNLGMPRPHNVLIPGIFVALNMGFKKLWIFGADHSWHEEIRIDENNKMMVNHEHFYDTSKHMGAMHKLDGNEYKIHDILRKLYLTFKGYYVLKSYAEKLGAVIINASKKSYIDAFERVKV
jgi:hypothetical protein